MMDTDDTQRLLGELYADSKNNRAKLESIEQKLEAVESKVAVLYKELSMYKTVAKTARFFLLLVVALLTFKFGDVTKYWHDFFG